MRNPAYYLTALALTITPLIAMEQQDNQGNSNQNTGWDNLPDELKIGIIGHTSPSDAANAGLVNKEWHDLANDDVAWKHRFQNDFQEYQEEPREGESSKDVYKELKMEHDRVNALIKQRLEGSNVVMLNKKGIFSLPSDLGDLIPQRVKMIGLANNNLTSLPSSTAKLTNLSELILRNNQLRALPDGLSNLKKLKRLHIENNPLDPLSVIKYLEAAPVGVYVYVSLNLVHEILSDEKSLELGDRYELFNTNESEQIATIRKVS